MKPIRVSKKPKIDVKSRFTISISILHGYWQICGDTIFHLYAKLLTTPATIKVQQINNRWIVHVETETADRVLRLSGWKGGMEVSPKMALEAEIATYKEKLPELAANEGKFVLIHGTEIVDTYGTYEDAIKEGYARFKLEPFLVKQIQSIEQIQFISRHLPCDP